MAGTVDQAIGTCGDLPVFGERVKPCILVVEDNQINRELLRDWLEVEDYEAWCAADLKESYEVFAKRLPDAVLLDTNRLSAASRRTNPLAARIENAADKFLGLLPMA